MFPSRSGHTMSASTHSTHADTSDIELREVGLFCSSDIPPPQTRPFTGVLDHHHCLLPHPSFPPTSHITRQPALDSIKPHKRHSSDVRNTERGYVSATQNPVRRHSSSSHRPRPEGTPPPYISGNMAEARQQVNSNDARMVREMENTPPFMEDMEMPPAINNMAYSGGPAGGYQASPQDYPMIDDTRGGPDTASGERAAYSSNNDKSDGGLRKTGNKNERFPSGASTSQHQHHPTSNKPGTRPATASITSNTSASNPSTSSRQSQGATPPLADSTVCTKQVKPNSFSPSKRNQLSHHDDDIIELQTDVKSGGSSQEEKQNKNNTRKEVPEVTEIPNTNFAIACMVALCFNLPFGILAMYFSLKAVKAFQEGRAKLGERRSRWSIVLSLLGITITTVIISSVVLYTAMQGQKRISRHKSYGTRNGLNL
ncbi:uncharacterized protein LOC143283786 [Babylonia areolata]|uniref:uncharacterized protein LOC143283786 n=1 Tax=Babylonia areolata TaxID=304850 RepID=UPI003FD614C0